MTKVYATSFLNRYGDISFSWTDEEAGQMEELFRQMMARGVTFFIIKPRKILSLVKPGSRSTVKAKNVEEIMDARRAFLKNNDLGHLLEVAGNLKLDSQALGDATDTEIERDPKKLAKKQSVGVAQLRGG